MFEGSYSVFSPALCDSHRLTLFLPPEGRFSRRTIFESRRRGRISHPKESSGERAHHGSISSSSYANFSVFCSCLSQEGLLRSLPSLAPRKPWPAGRPSPFRMSCSAAPQLTPRAAAARGAPASRAWGHLSLQCARGEHRSCAAPLWKQLCGDRERSPVLDFMHLDPKAVLRLRPSLAGEFPF